MYKKVNQETASRFFETYGHSDANMATMVSSIARDAVRNGDLDSLFGLVSTATTNEGSGIASSLNTFLQSVEDAGLIEPTSVPALKKKIMALVIIEGNVII